MSGNAAAVSVVLLPPLLFPPWPHHLLAPSENSAAVAEASDRLHWPLCMCMCALLFHCECTCSGSRPAKHHPANRSRLFPAQRDTQLLLLLLYLSATEIDKPRSVDDALVQLLPLLLPLLKPGRELVTDTTLSLVLRAVKQDTGTEQRQCTKVGQSGAEAVFWVEIETATREEVCCSRNSSGFPQFSSFSFLGRGCSQKSFRAHSLTSSWWCNTQTNSSESSLGAVVNHIDKKSKVSSLAQ